jgi:hypothetical protein
MTKNASLRVLLIALVLVLAVAVATPADAAKRKVPFGFFGTVLPPEMGRQAEVPDAQLDQEMP